MANIGCNFQHIPKCWMKLIIHLKCHLPVVRLKFCYQISRQSSLQLSRYVALNLLVYTHKTHTHTQLTKEAFSVLSPGDWPCIVWAAAYHGRRCGQISPGWTLLLLEALPWSRWTSESSASGIPYECKLQLLLCKDCVPVTKYNVLMCLTGVRWRCPPPGSPQPPRIQQFSTGPLYMQLEVVSQSL